MRAHHISISLIFWLILFSSVYSQEKTDSSYFPLAIGNQWIYKSEVEVSVDTETVIDTQRVNGKLYYGIAINSTVPSFWLRKDSDRVYITPTVSVQSDSSTIKESKIYDFSAKVNDQWSVFQLFNPEFIDCDYDGTIILSSKTDSVATPLEVYRNCFVFTHNPVCSDAGRSEEWFACGVGRISFYESYIWGSDRFNITKLNLPTTVSDRDHLHILNEYHLLQNYPNPFNPTTNIAFQLSVRSHVVLDIYDALGRKITTLVNSYLDSGYHSVVWDASNQCSGIYFCVIYTGTYSQTVKLVLLQ